MYCLLLLQQVVVITKDLLRPFFLPNPLNIYRGTDSENRNQINVKKQKMRKQFATAILGCMLAAMLMVGCKKEDFQKPPAPAKTNDVQFVFSAVPDAVPAVPAGLFVLVSLRNATGEDVVSNRKLAVTFNGKYTSEKLQLPDGAYTLSKFLVVGTSGDVRHAAPVAGSVKAQQVQKPLAMTITLSQTAAVELPVEVVNVKPGDGPLDFGYPAGSFQSANDAPASSIKVKLQAVVTIGSITYDSLPAQFTITSWDANGVAHQKELTLPAGVNEISVPKEHARFEFRLNKWGITDAVSLTKEQLQQDVIYTLGGSKVPKRLRREESFVFASGAYQPSSKTLYSYNAKGLSQVEFYQKLPQYAELQFTHKQLYGYNGNNVIRIDVLDKNNGTMGFSTYAYNAQGTKVVNMRDSSGAGQIYANVEHAFPTGSATITINYLYSNGNAMEYKMQYKGGNKVQDAALSSIGGRENGNYLYDHNINPYAHMNMPNLFLSNLSRNNLIGQQKTYAGAYPSAEPYQFEYTYDADGYPVELVKHFKNYRTGEYLYKIKTVYTYM